jgi:hypothetical protein
MIHLSSDSNCNVVLLNGLIVNILYDEEALSLMWFYEINACFNTPSGRRD